MGSTGAFLEAGGFTTYEWEAVGVTHGIKILEKKDKREELSLPIRSNTPGIAYIQLKDDGTFDQYRQYGENRQAKFDVDLEVHDGVYSLHIHYFDDDGRRLPPIIIATTDEVLDRTLYDRFKWLMKGVNKKHE